MQNNSLARLIQVLGDSGGQTSDFDLNPDGPAARSEMLRPAAVLVPILNSDDGLRVLLTKRASHLTHHPGQIAFPGGKIEDTDKTAETAALREAEEEVGLNPDTVKLLGRLPPHQTVTGFLVTPIVGLVTERFLPTADPAEVSEVFDVPYEAVTTPDRFSVQWRRWRGKPRYYYTVPHGPYYIWGATARILRGLADRVAQ